MTREQMLRHLKSTFEVLLALKGAQITPEKTDDVFLDLKSAERLGIKPEQYYLMKINDDLIRVANILKAEGPGYLNQVDAELKMIALNILDLIAFVSTKNQSSSKKKSD